MLMFCAITSDGLQRSHCILDSEHCHPGVILVDEVADGEPGTCNVVIPKRWRVPGLWTTATRWCMISCGGATRR